MKYFKELIVASLIFLSACQAEELQSGGEIHPVQQPFVHQIQAEGQIKPVVTETLNVPRRMWGTLETLVPEGTQVKAGQVVASINTRAFQERIGRYAERYEKENGKLRESQAGLPLEKLKLEAEIAEKARLEAQQALELQTVVAGPRLDQRVAARVDKEIAALKSDVFPIQQKQQLYDKGYLSEQELQQAQQELRGYQTQRSTAGLTLDQQSRSYRQPDIALEQLKNKALKLDTQIARLSAQAQQSLLKTQTQNQASQMRSTQRRFKSFQERIDNSDLKAPFDGTILYPTLWGNEKPHIGMDVWNGLAIVEVARTDQLMVRSRVDEFSIPHVEVGQRVKLSSPGFPNQIFMGTIAKIDKLAKFKDETKPVGLKYFDIDVALDGFAPLPSENASSHKGAKGAKGGRGKGRRQNEGSPKTDASAQPVASQSDIAQTPTQKKREQQRSDSPAKDKKRPVEAAAKQPNLELLKANMQVDLAIQIQSLAQAWMVPLETLIEKDQKTYLRLRENGQIIERPVEVLGRSENMAALKGEFTGQENLMLGAAL